MKRLVVEHVLFFPFLAESQIAPPISTVGECSVSPFFSPSEVPEYQHRVLSSHKTALGHENILSDYHIAVQGIRGCTNIAFMIFVTFRVSIRSFVYLCICMSIFEGSRYKIIMLLETVKCYNDAL